MSLSVVFNAQAFVWFVVSFNSVVFYPADAVIPGRLVTPLACMICDCNVLLTPSCYQARYWYHCFL
ncbi:hypothetical protein BDR03DRAFT_957598, partial [Suillus americanus]